MYFIRVTSYALKKCLRYINIKDIQAINQIDGVTEIYVGDSTRFKVKESPEQIFNLISEVLHANGEDFLYVHEGVKANKETPAKVQIVKM